MKTEPLVSVIIPTYDRAYVVCRAIESVLGQTYKNREIIVVDDGSTDDTQIRLRAYGDRIRVLTQENGGPSVARNRGIAVSRGEIVAFLDSDDYWLPTKLARQVELLEKAGPSVPCCLCNSTIVYNDGTRLSTFKISNIFPPWAAGLWLNPAEVLITRFVIFTQAVAIRREVLERAGFFEEHSLFFGEDYDFELRLALEGPWAVIRDELVVCQDASPGSFGQRALREEIRYRQDMVHMWERLTARIKDNRFDVRLRRLARWELQGAKLDLAAARLSRCEFSGAAILGRCLRLIQRYTRALYRRSPLYPHMIGHQLSIPREARSVPEYSSPSC
jgi:glycosyltransferase involved in cell wall biosynthesis